MPRSVKEHEAGAAGKRYSRLACRHSRNRCRRPVAFHRWRQSTAELGDIPGAADVHGEIALCELLIEVRHLAVADRRGVTLPEHADVKVEGTDEIGLTERAVAAAVGQQRRAGAEGQNDRFLPLIRWEKNGISGAATGLDPAHRFRPFAPCARRLLEPDRREHVGTIEEDARIDVPRHTVSPSAHDVRGPDPGKVVRFRDRSRSRRPVGQILQRPHLGELRDPGVSHLGDVGCGVSDEGCQQLLMRRRPWDLLHDDMHCGIAPLEFRNHVDDDFSFAPQSPEFDLFAMIAARRAGEGEHEEKGREARCRDEEPAPR